MAFPGETADKRPANPSKPADSGQDYYNYLIAYMGLASAALHGDQEAKAELELIDAAQALQTRNLELKVEGATLKTQLASLEAIGKLITGRRD